MSSDIAKSLAPGLEILLNQRVIAITPTPENSWRLTLESSNEELSAKALVVAIPAPQAVMLLSPLGESVLNAVFRPLAKVPNTPPPTPPRKRGGETKRSFGGVGFLFLIYARGLFLTICVL